MTGPPPSGPPPSATIRQILTSAFAPRALFIAADLRIADHLATGPRSIDDLGEQAQADAQSLGRVLRLLCAHGVFTEPEYGTFAQTPASDLLRADDPSGLRDTVLYGAGQFSWSVLAALPEAVVSGKSAVELAVGTDLWSYLDAHPHEAKLFDRTMLGLHGDELPAVAQALELPATGHVLDVGGGIGSLLAALLARNPGLTGTVVDQPQVIAACAETFAAHGVTDRANAVAGDLFGEMPAGNEVVLLSHIIHDWDREECLTILAGARNALAPGGRLLVVEQVLPEGDAFHPGKILDVAMLAYQSGRERTEADYRALLAQADLELKEVVSTSSAASIIVAAKVESVVN